MKKIILIDFETNGFRQTDDVLSVTAMEIKHNGKGKISKGNTFERYYYPINSYNPYAIAINGLDEKKISQLRGKAKYPRHYWGEDGDFLSLTEFIGGSPIIAHNIAFDSKFLVLTGDNQLFCTMLYLHKALNLPKHPKLSEAVTYLGIEIKNNIKLHTSNSDVQLLFEIMKELLGNQPDLLDDV